MGLLLDLSFEDNSERIANEYIGIDTSFMDEIISPIYPDSFLKHDKFLSKEEQELLYPDYEESSYNHRQINPFSLKRIFEKILEHLKNHHNEFPLVHMIRMKGSKSFKSLGGSTSDDFEYNRYKCHLDGYHNDYTHRHELCLARFNNGWETIGWIKADPTINFAGNTFYISTKNKFEQYKDILEELINICEQAIKTDKKLSWTFSN